MLVNKSQITDYIPQRQPMVMVDALRSCTAQEYISEFEVPVSSPFITNGQLNESGLVENMAQTAALGVGYFSVQNKQKVPLGFIGAIKNLQIHQLPKLGDKLTTRIEVMHEILNATLANGQVFLNNVCIAKGEFKIFINPLGEEA